MLVAELQKPKTGAVQNFKNTKLGLCRYVPEEFEKGRCMCVQNPKLGLCRTSIPLTRPPAMTVSLQLQGASIFRLTVTLTR